MLGMGALAAYPWAFSLSRSVDDLRAHREYIYRRTNAEVAIQRLMEFRDSLVMVDLYEHYFPKEFKRSHASANRRTPNCYSPLEIEFLRLVNWWRFPIGDFYEDEESFSLCIPLETMAMDDQNINEWEPVWQILYTLDCGGTDVTDWNALAAWLPTSATLPVCVTQRGQLQVQWKAFFRQAAQISPKLIDLQLAMAYATWDTGNSFLDVTYEMLGKSELPDWSQQNVDYLTEEWRKAQSLLKRANAVHDWLNKDPRRVARLIALYNVHTKIKATPQVIDHETQTEEDEPTFED